MLKKLVTREERQEINNLSEYAFNNKLTPEMNEHYLELWKHTTNWAAVVDEKVASQIVVLPFKVNLFGESIKMAGIGNVATYPEYRGTGSISQLFTAIFEELKEDKTVLSYLAPFSQPFYRHYGYEIIFNTIESIVDQKDIEQLPREKNGQVKRVDFQQEAWQQVVKDLYRDTLAKKNGSLIRDDWWWQKFFRLAPTEELAVCFDSEGKPAGYLVYRMSAKELFVKEIAGKNAFALRKLGSFIASHSGSFETFRYQGAMSDQIDLLFADSRVVKQRILPGMMVKIISFPRLIDQLNFHPTVTETFTIALEDISSDWNHGTWKLKLSEGKGEVTLISDQLDQEADFRGSVQAWTQVLLGSVSLSKQVFNEKIIANSLTKTDALTKAIPASQLALYDYF